jgi:hypothetical protein
MMALKCLPGSISVASEGVASKPQEAKHVDKFLSSLLARRPVVHPVITTPANNPVAGCANDATTARTRSESAALIVPVFVAVVTLVCFTWTLLLLALNVAPNAAVNRIMGTEEFDNGTFWQLINPSPSLLTMAVVALGPVAVAYAFVLVDIVTGGFTGSSKVKATNTTIAHERQSRTASVVAIKDKIVAAIEHATDDGARTGSRFGSCAAKLVSNLARSDSTTRKLAVRTSCYYLMHSWINPTMRSHVMPKRTSGSSSLT